MNDSGIDVVVDVLVAPIGVVQAVSLQVVPPNLTIASGGKLVVVVPIDSTVDSGNATTFEVVVATTVVFAASVIGVLMNPVLAEFDGRKDGAHSVRRDPPTSLPVKHVLGGSDPPKTKWALSNFIVVPLREAKHTRAGMSSYKKSSAEVER
ncbi:hypothetical protein V6N13_029784 [Hibiscus sabdariffa]|uniref:Uncharacterized protein n=1 Tax=Hibiscus sabdariffa TaxID=183260 RepID=A0ABR2T9A1_9ROSI